MTFVSEKFTIEEFNASAINSTTEEKEEETRKKTITINSHDKTELIVTKVSILCIKEHAVEVAIISVPSLLNLQLTLCVFVLVCLICVYFFLDLTRSTCSISNKKKTYK